MSLAVLIGPAPGAGAVLPEDSVVRVFTTMRLPNPVRPWARQNPVEVTGKGVIIEGKRFLTNAHVVLYASEIAVPGEQGDDRFGARIETIGPDIDLATLPVDDPTFFERRPPMPRAPHRPGANAAVAVLGFSVVGNSLAVTRGVVSRIDYVPYHGLTEGLHNQVYRRQPRQQRRPGAGRRQNDRNSTRSLPGYRADNLWKNQDAYPLVIPFAPVYQVSRRRLVPLVANGPTLGLPPGGSWDELGYLIEADGSPKTI
jgi:hypothetical protein